MVDDARIAELNQCYLQRRGPTNVIAFPMREGGFVEISPHLLGDVVISVETAAREGRVGGMCMQDRVTQLLVHGILHLLGYDHENDPAQAREMELQNTAVLEHLRVANLYPIMVADRS